MIQGLLAGAHAVRRQESISSDLLIWGSHGASSSFRRPKSPRSLTDESRRIAPQLRMNGLSITYERSREKRLFALKIAICAQPVRHT